MGSTAFIFVGIFFVLIFIPCVGVGWLGKQTLDKLGKYPSKTPAVQMDVVLKLVVLEVVSLTLLLLFFKILVAE